jgi:hypothetical protein
MLDLNEYGITTEVCRQIAHTPEPRLRGIVTALVQRLLEFCFVLEPALAD